MLSQRQNGTDVDVWDMDDLVEAVEEFIRQQTVPEERSPRYDHTDEVSVSNEHQSDYTQPIGPPEYLQYPSKSEDIYSYGNFDEPDNIQKSESLQPQQKKKKDKTLSFFSRRELIVEGEPIPHVEETQIVEDEKEDEPENVDDDYDTGYREVKTAKPIEFPQKYQEEEEKVSTPKMVKQSTSIVTAVPGIKMPLTELNRTKGLYVEILDSEIVDEGFFSAKYLSFKVKVMPFDTVIDRRDKDFNTLRE